MVVPDGDAVGAALRAAVADGHAVVITTGGTGLNPADHTPEQTRSVLEREIPQLAAAIARYGVEHGVPTAVLSRGIAGVAGRTLIINLPGSSGGARDGMAVLARCCGTPSVRCGVETTEMSRRPGVARCCPARAPAVRVGTAGR